MLRVSSERVAALLGLYEGPQALTDQIWLHDKNVLAARLILNNIAEYNADNIIGSHSQDTNPTTLRKHSQFHNETCHPASPNKPNNAPGGFMSNE